jgi:hypothetical protein
MVQGKIEEVIRRKVWGFSNVVAPRSRIGDGELILRWRMEVAE